MKTLQELYKEVMASPEMKKEFIDAAGNKENGRRNLEDFLKKNGCDATFDELKLFLNDRSEDEIGEDELEAVAGGKIDWEKLARQAIEIGEIL